MFQFVAKKGDNVRLWEVMWLNNWQIMWLSHSYIMSLVIIQLHEKMIFSEERLKISCEWSCVSCRSTYIFNWLQISLLQTWFSAASRRVNFSGSKLYFYYLTYPASLFIHGLTGNSATRYIWHSNVGTIRFLNLLGVLCPPCMIFHYVNLWGVLCLLNL